uniref:Uncharacterized protein n=1 Tax=Avena sativa TaxID=4498 RepID=A0ACD5UPN6_AVESA
MKLIGWNCQGPGRNLDRSKKMGYLDNLMSSTKAQVTFVSEIRTSKYNSTQLNNRFNIADSFVVPSAGFSGGLWLLWTDEVQVTINFSSHHLILATVVNIASNIDFVLVCVYGTLITVRIRSSGTKFPFLCMII